MSDVDEVKSRLNIVDVIGARVPLKKAGRHFKALCPFHSEKTPSFIVSPERQTWHCFGCGKGGSVIDFVMEYEHVDFVEALETLAEKAGVKLERRATDTPEAKLKQKMYEVNHLASEFYHYLLTQHKLGEKARSYLKNRGITEKSIKTFMLGYSPNSWDGLTNYLQKKGYEKNLLEQAGLLIASARGGYDRFRGRVMFTLKDHRGNVVGFSGRLLDPEAKEAKYINTSETPVYSKSNVLYGLDVAKDAIRTENEAVIVEGEFDVISSFQAGIGNVVAIKGSALTEGHVNLLKRFAEKVVFALDSDLAGDAAARRGIAIADKAGLELRVATMPSGKDPDEAARQSAGLLKKAIKDAQPIYDYFISSALVRFDMNSAYGKKKATDELLPIVAAIDNPIVQEHYVKILAKAIDVSEGALDEGIKKAAKATAMPATQPAEQSSPDALSRIEKLELYVAALVLQGKTQEFLEELLEAIPIVQFVYQPIGQLLSHLSRHLKSHPSLVIKDFSESLPKELLPVLDEAYLWDVGDFVDDENKLIKEWSHAMRLLREAHFRKTISDLSKQLKDVEIESKERTRLEEELTQTTKNLNALVKSASI
ncbi:DNA primase [Candidatus Gottesmanbacteria bacterium]|nr:DNA primase [Candidatus Gottesmanbacteria bacterium]